MASPTTTSSTSTPQHTLQKLMPNALAQRVEREAIGLKGRRKEAVVLCWQLTTATDNTIQDEEDLRYLLTDRMIRLIGNVIYPYEGIIHHYDGSRLVALFGVPIAHENDVERAVRAALDLTRDCRTLGNTLVDWGIQITVRIAVHVGTVIVGQVVDPSDPLANTAILGTALSVAELLCQQSAPNTVLVSANAQKRTGDAIEYRRRALSRPLADQGFSHAFQALRGWSNQGTSRGIPGITIPMVGRDAAIEQLTSAWNEVRQTQHSQIAIIAGEAGVGKSRLVKEFVDQVASSGARTFEGSCLTYTRTQPLRLLTDLLCNILGIADDETSATKQDAVNARLAELNIQEPQTRLYLCSILGVISGERSTCTQINALDDATLQKLTHAAVSRLLTALVAQRPTVLVLEDLRWIDTASLSALQYLVRTLSDLPALIIWVCREEAKTGTLHPLLETAETINRAPVEIGLMPLSRQSCEKLVHCLLPATTDRAKSIQDIIVERSEGNPLYAEETFRMLLNQGGLRRHGDEWMVAPDAETIARKIPPTLQGMTLARMDSLPDDLRFALQCSAVIGSPIAAPILAQMLDASERDVEVALDQLVSREFLASNQDIATGTGISHVFGHDLIRESVYSTLLRRDRQRLHEIVAQAIENDGHLAHLDRAETLAYHYGATAQPDRAVPYLRLAAERASRRCAYRIAIDHYRRALSYIDAETIDKATLLQIQIGLGQALKQIGSYTKAKELLEKALQVALYRSLHTDQLDPIVNGLRELADIRHREGDSDQAVEFLKAGIKTLDAQHTPKASSLRRSLIERMAWIRFRQGELDKAYDLANVALAEIHHAEAHDVMIVASLHNTLGGVLWQKGNLAGAVTCVTHSREIYRRQGYTWGMANSNANLGVLHFALGEWRQAAADLTRAAELWGEIGDLRHLAITLNNLGTLHQAQGKHQEAIRDLEQGRDIFERLGEPWGLASTHTSLARLQGARSETASAILHAQEAARLFKQIGVTEIELLWVTALLQAEVDLSAGIASASEGRKLARDRKLPQAEANCLRVLGTLARMRGDYSAAESWLREAIDLCVEAEAPYELGLAWMELGKLHETPGWESNLRVSDKHVLAIEAADQAVAQFRELGAAKDLEEAQLLRSRNVLAHQQTASTGGSQSQSLLSELNTPIPDGETRTVAVVWISMTPATGAHEENVFAALANVVPIVSGAAEHYQAQVVRHRQGTLLVFGAPKAFEDDTERAVKAAWQIQDLLRATPAPERASLKSAIVVARDQALVGFIGEAPYSEFFVQGRIVRDIQNLASRAPSAEIWVTEEVHRTTTRIAKYTLAVAQPHPTWRLEGFKETPADPRGIPELRTRMIGRDGALRQMLQLTGHLSQGIGSLVWIEGEPGIGKSRLIAEYATAATTQGLRLWQGSCVPQSSTTVFGLFSSLLSQILDASPSTSPEATLARIDAAFSSRKTGLQTIRPYIEILLGIEPTGAYGERLAALTPEQLRQQIFVSLRRFLKNLSQQSPCIIVLDDLHWIDPISAELLQFLLPLIASSPIVFICAQRRQGGDAPNDRLIRIQSLLPDQTLRFTLNRLTEEERETLLDELLPTAPLPPGIRSTILTQSDGNPYFIEEYVRMLLDDNYITFDQDRWRLQRPIRADTVSLPSSLETLIRSRVDALPNDLREVVQTAAVLGAPFEPDVLAAILERTDVDAALTRLASRLLVRQELGTKNWIFHHPMIAGVIYSSLLATRRTALHERIAAILEARWAGEATEHANVLAYHLQAAGLGEQALTYLVSAGEHAAARYANEAAIDYLTAAAKTLSLVPNASDTLRWRLAAVLGDVYRAQGHHDDSMASLRAGLALTQTGMLRSTLRAGLYRRMGETARKQGEFEVAQSYLRAALDTLRTTDSTESEDELTSIYLGLGWLRFQQGSLKKALQAGQQSLTLAARNDNLSRLSAAENLLGGIYYRQGELDAALEHTQHAMELREKMGYTWGVAGTLSNLGVLAVLKGDWQEARTFFQRSLEMREEMDDTEGLAVSHNNLAMLCRDQGKLSESESYFRTSLATLKPFAEGYHYTNAMLGLASVLVLQGKTTSARECLDAGLALAQEIGADDLSADGRCIEIDLLRAEGLPTAARMAAESTLDFARRTESRNHIVRVLRLISELELQVGNTSVAQAAIRQARTALGTITDMLEEGRIHLQAARIAYAESGEPTTRTDLDAARGIFVKLGAQYDIAQTEALDSA